MKNHAFLFKKMLHVLPICHQPVALPAGSQHQVVSLVSTQHHRARSPVLIAAAGSPLAQHFPTRPRTWQLRPPPPPTQPPRRLLRRRSPRLHPHPIKRSLLLLPFSPTRQRQRLRQHQHPPLPLRQHPQPRRSGSSRRWGSTPPTTTRSAPSSPTCVSASSRFALNFLFVLNP